jgi:hypothetical protein
MERFQTALPSAQELPLRGIRPLCTFERNTGPHEWPGRFWLPDGDSVYPAREFCLVCADGQLGEMTMHRFAPSGV